MNTFEQALARFNKQKNKKLERRAARRDARKNALALKQSRVLRYVGVLTTEQKKRRAAEQPARIESWVNAFVAWIRLPPRKRKLTPAPEVADFGITNELRAMNYFFKTIRFE